MKNNPAAAHSKNVSPMPPVSVGEGLKAVMKNKHIWITGFAVGLILAATMCLNTFLPQALNAVRGVDAVSAGAFSSVLMFGSIAGSILGPVICSKIGRMKLYLFIFCMIAAVGVAFAWLAPLGIIIMICLFVTGFVNSGIIAQLVSIPVMLPGIGPSLAGSAGGFVATIQLICGVLLPSYIIAPIVGDNFRLLYIIAGILAVGAAFLTLTMPELLGNKSSNYTDAY